MRYSLLIQPAKIIMTLCFLSTFAATSYAQTVPDAGRILQDTMPDRNYQPREMSPNMNLQGAPLTERESGGSEVRISKVNFNGNTIYDDSVLKEQILTYLGQDLDMAELQDISNRISRFYRENGYVFAQAVLPRQDLSDNTLEVSIIEGHFGSITASGKSSTLNQQAQSFLASLRPGDVIMGEKLERTALLMEDLPGINIVPVMRPGDAPGTGDLDVHIEPTKRFKGQVGLDNHGSRSSGENRTTVGIQANRLFTLGDELSLTALYSEEDLWLGRLAYSFPLGTEGWRAQLSYARTEYDLRDPFTGLTGTADVTRAEVSYPFIRSQKTNIAVSAAYEYTELNDRFEGTSYQQRNGHSLPLALQFDHRDSIGAGGVTFGEARINSGEINHNQNGSVDGGYTKANLWLSRIQNLGNAFSLLAHGNVQWADTSLDSSEMTSLGGPRDVRAYPSGAVNASRAWLAQLELRYQASASAAPYIFYDQGARLSFENEKHTEIAGGGIGMRYAAGSWSADAAVAFQTTGETLSSEEQKDPRFWFSASYAF